MKTLRLVVQRKNHLVHQGQCCMTRLEEAPTLATPSRSSANA
jgi:hypothetical protein